MRREIDTEHINFERELPEGYVLAKHIDAKRLSFGVIFNLIALVIWIAVTAVGVLIFRAAFSGEPNENASISAISRLICNGILMGLIPTLAYIVLHELAHGWAYKRRTGEKLTFGLSWSCAFCGVPNIHVYRGSALLALLMPLAVFTPILIVLAALCLVMAVRLDGDFVSRLFSVMYFALVFVFGMHLGGSSGDGYVTLLLLSRYRDKRTLVRDTGPEQYIYVPAPDCAE